VIKPSKKIFKKICQKKLKNEYKSTKSNTMKRLEEILNQYSFSETTLQKVFQKKTEAGAIRELCTLDAFREAFPSDEFVFERLINAMRINANDLCVCGAQIGRNHKRVEKRKLKCTVCKRRFNPLAVTPLHTMKYPLNKFLEFAYWTYTSRKGYATAMINRHCNGKYDTLHSLRLRMNEWMGMALDKMEFLPGIPIEADEVFPPIPDGLPKNVKRTRGPQSEGVKRHHVLAQRDGLVKVQAIEDSTKQVIQPIFHASVSAGSVIYTDEAPVYNFLKNDPYGYLHESVNHSKKEFAIGDAHTNYAESYNGIMKRQIKHVHNGVSEEHVTGYAEDTAWAFTHRHSDLYKAIDSLFNALPPLNLKSVKNTK
jgi:transposase